MNANATEPRLDDAAMRRQARVILVPELGPRAVYHWRAARVLVEAPGADAGACVLNLAAAGVGTVEWAGAEGADAERILAQARANNPGVETVPTKEVDPHPVGFANHPLPEGEGLKGRVTSAEIAVSRQGGGGALPWLPAEDPGPGPEAQLAGAMAAHRVLMVLAGLVPADDAAEA